MTAERTENRPWLALIAAAPALLLGALQMHWCWPFFSDDAFISLRFADRLLTGHGLTWTDGDAVEGYSNLLWVLATAALGSLGLDLVAAARLLGFLCTAVGFWLLARTAAPRDLRSTLAATAAPLLVAGTPQVMAWTLGGLEGPLVFVLLCWGLAGLLDAVRSPTARPARAWLAPGLPFALLCLTRPDGALWIALAAATMFARGRRLAPAVALAVPSAVAFAGQLVFRIAYHGDIVPNTAHVKVGMSGEVLTLGIEFVRDALLAMPVLGALAALAIVLLRRRPGGALAVLLLPAIAWFAYLVAVGGDHFVAYRLFHPALAPLALLVAAACRQGSAAPAFAWCAAALGVLGGLGNAYRARTESLSAMARGERWEWQGKAIGETLAGAFGGTAPRIAVDAAGAVPFYSRLPAIDMLGLCDRTIAATPVPDWVGAAAKAAGLVRPQGHTHGNGGHVLDLAPDLIQFGQPPGQPLPIFVSGLELESDPRFLANYRLVRLAHEAIAGPWLWIRLDGRAGAARSGDDLVIPAYLFGSYRMPRPIQCRFAWLVGDPAFGVGTPQGDERNAAQLGLLGWMQGEVGLAAVAAADGRLELAVQRPGPIALQLPATLLPPDGEYEVRFEPVDAPWRGAVQAGEVRIEPAAGTPLPTRLRAVTLRRRP